MIGIHIVERSKCQRNRKKKSATVETKLGNADDTARPPWTVDKHLWRFGSRTHLRRPVMNDTDSN